MQMNKNCYKVVTSTVTGLQIEARIHYHLDLHFSVRLYEGLYCHNCTG